MKKTFIFGGVLILLSIFAIYLIVANVSTSIPSVQSGDSLHYAANVCKQVVRADGTREEAECSHNILYNTGRNITRDKLIGTAGVAITNITLCNASTAGTGCATPVAAGNEAYTEFIECGLKSNSAGTASVLEDQPGNWTVWKTFTSTCNNMLVNVTRLGNNSVYFAGNSFTLVTLQTSDSLTVNWTIYLL